LISLELTEPCVMREAREGEGTRRLGVDVARTGADRTVLVLRQGSVVDYIKVYGRQDTMQTVGCIVAILKSWRVDEVAVDVIGLGAGVYDRLAELKRQGHIACQVTPVNVAEKAPPVLHPADAKPRLLRDYLWLEVAQWLREEAPVFCAEDRGACDDLAGELASVGYGVDSHGCLVVEDKDHMRKRLGHSPDIGDALCCTFAPGRPRAGTVSLRF
jgi:phage terminase large subunit